MKIPHILALAAATLLCGCQMLCGCGKPATTTVSGASGEPERKLTLEQPAKMTLEQGGMAKADIKLKRQACPGDVSVRFDKLPKGVEVLDADQKIPGDSAAFTLKAGDGADLVANYVAEVTAAGPGGLVVTEPFEITVTAKK
jgi:hypothetical protein